MLRGCVEPFGGLQLILVGDHRQTESIDSAFVNSDLYKQLNFIEIVLPEHPNMRLLPNYMKFCNLFRNPKLNKRKMVELLENDKFAKRELKNAYTVYYTNNEVNERNTIGMENFKGDVIYETKTESYKRNCPIYITSKYGDLCNGMMGFLRECKDKKLILDIDNNIHTVPKDKLSFVPGFAMTIHKCQSKTFPGVNIFLSKQSIYEERTKLIRLIYVALTRVRNFNRCYIKLY